MGALYPMMRDKSSISRYAPCVRLRIPLRSQVRTANEANANEPANESASPPATPAPKPARRPGWWSRRQEIRLAARRAYARVRTTPTSLSRTAEGTCWTISGLAYAISYASLYDLAYHHNFHGPANWESIAWPTTVDLASLATGIIAIDQAGRGESARLATVISAVAAAIMVAGNVVANWGDPISMAMHAWPPVIALACWYLLVRTRRENARLLGLVADEDALGPEAANDGSQPPAPRPPRPGAKRIDARVLRIARTGGDWRVVAEKTGLKEHAAKRELTAARKQLASESQTASAEEKAA